MVFNCQLHIRYIPRTLLIRTQGAIRKETLADHFAQHIFLKDKEDVFMELVKEIVKQ